MEDQFPTVSSPAPKAEEGGLCNNLFYWLQTLVYAVVAIVLVFTFLGRITRVEGDSMLSTLHEGDLLLLQSVGYTPETGDVVVLNKLQPISTQQQNSIKNTGVCFSLFRYRKSTPLYTINVQYFVIERRGTGNE